MAAAPQPESRIFISYRREDSSGHVLALLPALKAHFGADRIFKDTDNIPAGVDFVKFIRRELESCAVLLAIIGREWLTIQDPRQKRRRLDNPEDFLRVEVATALKNESIRVIPVLVERGVMPAAEDLPPDLAALTYRNAIELSDVRWDSDVRRLVEAIQRACAPPVEAAEPAAQRPELQNLQKRRAREIAMHLAAAREALDGASYEAALWACEKALVLDPQAVEALELLDRARKAIDGQKIEGWLSGARTALAEGDLSRASELIDQTLALEPGSLIGLALRQELLRQRRDRELAREQARLAEAAAARARGCLEEEDFEGAVRHAEDALALDPELAPAQKVRAQAIAALDERRRARDDKRRAQQAEAEVRARAEAEADARQEAETRARDEAAAEARREAEASARAEAAAEALRQAEARARDEAAAEARRQAEARARAEEAEARRRAEVRARDKAAARARREAALAAVLRVLTTRRAWGAGAAVLLLAAAIGVVYVTRNSTPAPATAPPDAVTPAGPEATPSAAPGAGGPVAGEPVQQPPPATPASTGKPESGSGRQEPSAPPESATPRTGGTASPRRDPAASQPKIETSTAGTPGDSATRGPRAGPPASQPRVELPATPPRNEPPAPQPVIDGPTARPESSTARPAEKPKPAEPAPNREEARTAGTPPVDTRPAAPAPPPAAPAVSRAEEERRIAAVMRRYEAAYDTLNAREVLAVYPSQPPGLSKAFASYRSYDLGIDIRKIDLSADASDATVAVQMSHDFRPVVGRQQRYSDTQTFTLRKQGDAWIIVGRK